MSFAAFAAVATAEWFVTRVPDETACRPNRRSTPLKQASGTNTVLVPDGAPSMASVGASPVEVKPPQYCPPWMDHRPTWVRLSRTTAGHGRDTRRTPGRPPARAVTNDHGFATVQGGCKAVDQGVIPQTRQPA